MPSIMDLAAPTAARVSTYAQYTALRPELFDAVTNKTRALAARDSDQAPYCIIAVGAHTDVIASHNERSRIAHERAVAVKAFEVEFADSEPSEDDTAVHAALLADLDTALDAIVKTKALATTEVARTLMLYAAADETEADADSE